MQPPAGEVAFDGTSGPGSRAEASDGTMVPADEVDFGATRRRSMSEDRTGVESVAQAFSECWNRHDMESFGELFAEDAEFVNVVGLWWRGREEIERAHAATHATIFKNSRLAIGEIAVRFLESDIAIARCRWELTGHVSPSGEALSARRGVLMTLLQRRGGAWKILDAQNTDIIEGVLAPPQ